MTVVVKHSRPKRPAPQETAAVLDPAANDSKLKILEDGAVNCSTPKDLRAAYKELRALYIDKAAELKSHKEQMAARDAHIAAALFGLRAQGKYTGGLERWGFKLAPDGDGETLQVNESELRALARAVELRACDADLSLRAIARTLAEEGYRSRNKTAIAPSQIKRLLSRAGEAK